MTYGVIKKRASAVRPMVRTKSRTLAQAVSRLSIPRGAAAKFMREYSREFAKELRLQVSKEISSKSAVGSIKDVGAFISSLKIRVNGDLSVEVLSNFPFFERLIEGADPFPMEWLTRENGVDVVPLIDDNGEVIFRTTPLTVGDAWIHPGIAKHTFMAKALDRTRRKTLPLIKDFVKDYILPAILNP